MNDEMYHIKFYLSVCFLLTLISQNLCDGKKDFERVCIRCLCNSYTECKDMINCARLTINNKYWLDTMKDEVDYDDYAEEPYEECKENGECIIRTIRNFVNLFGYVDCNGDQQMDCIDYAAIHLSKSKNCQNYQFPAGYLFRLNGCIMREYGRNMPLHRPVLTGSEPSAV